jgi:diguanylate cyclase (GGDEF)-like protein
MPEDPYWGLDINLARRMAGLFTLIGVNFAVSLWPLSPLSDQIGNEGWTMALGVALLGFAAATLILLRPSFWGYGRLAVVAFCSVPAISVMQWLAGGSGEPYEIVLLIPVLFVAAIYPPRVIACFVLLCGASLAAPLFYDEVSGDLVANAAGPFLLIIGISAAVRWLLLQIRTQRVAMAEGEQHARAEARIDELTEIPNRRAFEETLVDEISRADRMGTPLSMAMGDIEHFKQINDEFGHLEGDRCLNGVAQAMESELRVPDRVFRWGGDEFVLLLPGTDADGAQVVIERVQANVSAACLRPDNDSIWIHFAAAELQPDMSGEELCEAADLALMAERAQSHRART